MLRLSSSDHALVVLSSNSEFLVIDVRVELSLCLLVKEVDHIFLIVTRIMDHSLSSLVENVYENSLLAHDRELYGLLDEPSLSFTKSDFLDIRINDLLNLIKSSLTHSLSLYFKYILSSEVLSFQL